MFKNTQKMIFFIFSFKFKENIYFSNAKNKNKIQFSDLNVDCQLLILQKLNYFDLVSFSSVNNIFSALASDVFRRKLKNKLFRIEEPLQMIHDNLDATSETPEALTIYDYGMVLSMLEHFGSHITKLEIQYDEDESNQLKSIIRNVNRFCNNLIYLSLEAHISNPLDDIRKPFSNVINLTIIGEMVKIKNEDLNCNEMFPKLNKLKLRVDSLDKETINLFIPQLNTLDLTYTLKQLHEFILKNPQIQNLYFDHSIPNFLEFVSKNMPNLEKFSTNVMTSANYNGYIHFKTVKSFKIGEFFGNFLGTLAFDQLDEFVCHSKDFRPSDVIKIFKN